MLPSDQATDSKVQWARDRSVLWNTVESYSDRANSRLGREVLVALPSELNSERRIDLARSFSQQLSDKHRAAVDLAVHEPRPGSSQDNFHAHLLMTTREITTHGLGQRINLELNGQDRLARGLGTYRDDFNWIRQQWGDLTNDSLRSAGIDARVDHRTYAERALNQEPVFRLPATVFYLERNTGKPTEWGDRLRAEHRQRVQARERGPDALEKVVQMQKEAARRYIESRDLRRSLAQFARENPTPTAEESVKRWLDYTHSLAVAEPGDEKAKDRSRGNDFAL